MERSSKCPNLCKIISIYLHGWQAVYFTKSPTFLCRRDSMLAELVLLVWPMFLDFWNPVSLLRPRWGTISSMKAKASITSFFCTWTMSSHGSYCLFWKRMFTTLSVNGLSAVTWSYSPQCPANTWHEEACNKLCISSSNIVQIYSSAEIN